MIDSNQLPPSSTHPHGWGPFIAEVATPDARTYGEQLRALEPEGGFVENDPSDPLWMCDGSGMTAVDDERHGHRRVPCLGCPGCKPEAYD